MLLLGFQLSCGKSVKYRFIELFTFIVFLVGSYFYPLAALDKIYILSSVTKGKVTPDQKKQ